MKRYVAQSTPSGVEVLVSHSDHPNDTSALHALPGGFEWGYEGSGPQRLASALLADVVVDRFGEAFMQDVVSKASPIEGHESVVVFHEKNILDWLRDQLNKVEE